MAFCPARFVSLLRSALSRNLSNLFWSDAGDLFYIRQPHGIMVEHFNGIQYTSFVRQLHMYGFKNVRVEYEFGGSAFAHALFTRDKPEDDVNVNRKRQGNGLIAPPLPRKAVAVSKTKLTSTRAKFVSTPNSQLKLESKVEPEVEVDADVDADAVTVLPNKRARTELTHITSMLENLKANVMKLETIVHEVVLDTALRNAQFAALEADLNSLPTRAVALGLKWDF
jgi:hypothetical protein